MAFVDKALWIEFMNEGNKARVLSDVKASGVNIICVRTETPLLPALMKTFKEQMKLKVYGWMYPHLTSMTDHPDPTKPARGGYAKHEADYVAQTLIPAGLDGYIMDIESHNGGANKNADWDRKDMDLTPLATYYTTTIKKAAGQANRPFVIGFTSHVNCFNIYPGTPWAQFKAVTDVMFPQTYWRKLNDANKCVDTTIDPKNHTSSPEYAMDFGFKNYSIWNKRIIPMAGEIRCCTADQLKRFGAHAATHGVSEGHFYVSYDNIPPDVLNTVKQL